MVEEIEKTGFAFLKFTPAEVDRLRQLIYWQWVNVINNATGEVEPFGSMRMDEYHLESWRLNHGKLWNKNARILPADAAQEILAMETFKTLGDIEVTDEEEVGHPEFIFRLVRPGLDVGHMHADAWFWKVLGRTTPRKRARLWISVYCEPGQQGIRYVPGSHLKEWKWSECHEKPSLLEECNPIKFESPPGGAILFHDKLVHGGFTGGTRTRVSLECTVLYG